MSIEEAGTLLISNAQRVCEPASDGQQRPIALALEQRIRRDGGAHLHGVDGVAGEGLAVGEAEHISNALQSGVVISLRVLRQELVRDQRSIGPTGHDVGERAATIDPELPAFRRIHAIPV